MEYFRQVAIQTGDEPWQVEEVFREELLRLDRLFDCLEKVMSPTAQDMVQRT